MSGTLLRRLNYGIQNQHIQDVIEKRGISSEGMIQYNPLVFDRDIFYTNKVLRNVLGDSCYSWANPFSNSRNSFGKPQYYREQKFPFMLIGNKDEALKQLTQPVTRSPNELVTCALRSGGVWSEDLCTVRSSTTNNFPFKKLAFTNFWIMIDNPQQLKLRDLIQTIEFEIGGILHQRYCCYDIENQINILAYIFGVDGIKYEDGRICIPLVVPFNVLILNGTYHQAKIRCRCIKSWLVDFKIYANVCDVDAFTELAHTDEFTHRCNFVYYRTQFTGTETICKEKNTILMNFMHPCYAIYIMNISKEYITSIKLLWDHYSIPGVYHEYLLDDMEWFDNHVILWFNRNFKVFSEMNKNFNFSCSPRPNLIIENTYTEPREIEIVAVNFDLFSYGSGVSGMRYIG
jgi:hypothetical protein